MKNGQIFARKSIARGRLDLEYLDETSSRKVSLRERNNLKTASLTPVVAQRDTPS